MKQKVFIFSQFFLFSYFSLFYYYEFYLPQKNQRKIIELKKTWRGSKRYWKTKKFDEEKYAKK